MVKEDGQGECQGGGHGQAQMGQGDGIKGNEAQKQESETR